MPTIRLENCVTCLKCVNDCPSDAIEIETGIISETCIHCGHCVAICPELAVIPDKGKVELQQSHTVTPQQFQELSANLRTCRSFLDKEVDPETLDKLIDNMRHCPSASNARPIKIAVIKSKSTIEKLNQATSSNLLKTISFLTSPLVKGVLKLISPKLNFSKLEVYKRKFLADKEPGSSQICHHAPLVLLFHAPEQKYGMAAADAYIWATYTSLYAGTLGLGTCFNGFIVNAMQRNKGMRKAFGLPEGNQVYASLLIGYPNVKYPNQTGREAPIFQMI